MKTLDEILIEELDQDLLELAPQLNAGINFEKISLLLQIQTLRTLQRLNRNVIDLESAIEKIDAR